jgi:hypothetical protein
MTDATTPTPPPADAQNSVDKGVSAITDALAKEFGYDEIRWFSVAATISKALTDAGYTITSAQAGVTIPLDAAKLIEAVIERDTTILGFHRRWLLEELSSAIASATPDPDEEKTNA